MSLEKIEIPLFSVVSDDPFQRALDLDKVADKDAKARNELDELLTQGWREIASASYMTPNGAVLCIVLFKDESVEDAPYGANAIEGLYSSIYGGAKLMLKTNAELPDLVTPVEKINTAPTEQIYLHPVGNEGD